MLDEDGMQAVYVGGIGRSWQELSATFCDTSAMKGPLGHLKDLLGGGNLVLIEDNTFKAMLNTLPVIARNYLDNGISKNLWYEEIVPHQTRFYTFIAKSTNATTDLLIDKQTIQIGGNATIGYGFCKFTAQN